MTSSTVMDLKETQESINSTLTALRGQSVVLPDLNAILDGWPRETNRHYDQLRRDLNDWLDSAMSHNSKLKAIKEADFAYFSSTWWPQARYERLRIATFLAVWIFAWDDELDMDSGPLLNHLELADLYRHETQTYVRACLGLTGSPQLESFKSSDATIQAFEIIGNAIRQVYNYEQRQRVIDAIEKLLDGNRREQVLYLRNTLPSNEEYWSHRLGSSSVPVIIAITEFTWDMNLRTSVMKNTDMKLLWEYTNIIISTVNDILSLKKEIACRRIDSIIPLLYAQTGDLQAAMDQAAELIITNVKAFEETAKRLQKSEQETCNDSEEARKLHHFITGCRFYCTENLTWSLVTRRYGILEKDLSAGIRITL